MTSITSNSIAAQQITPAIILANITKAKSAFVSSKEAAGEAVARAYLVWTDTMSPKAHADGIKWMQDAIRERNQAIDQYNKEDKALQAKAERFMGGKLKDDNWLNSNPETDAERAELAKERALLTALNAMSQPEWAARRKVRVEAREGASKFVELVKFVFEFDKPSDSSLTSRYATVLDWVDAQFAAKSIDDISEITDAIKAAGGFEVVLNKQRGNVSSDAQEAKDRETIAKAISSQAKAAVETAPARAKFDMPVKDAQDGIILVLGRYRDGKVEVVGRLPLGSDDLDKAISQFNDDALLPRNDHVEFLARVVALGELVDEGRASNITVDGLVAGKKEVEQRTLSVVPNDAAGLELVVSARFADACLVIKAVPNPEAVSLGHVTLPLMMPWKQGSDLAKQIEDCSTRRLLDFAPAVDEDRLSWSITNSALMARSSENAEHTYFFSPLVDEPNMPMDVDVFKPQFAVEVEVKDLRALYQAQLKIWKDAKDSKKNDRHMVLAFKDQQMICAFPGTCSSTLACIGTNPVGVSMKFRPRDLHDLVLQLTKQPVDHMRLSGDSSGLLCVSWSDRLGRYSIYLPTATSENKLEHRRVAPMRIEAAVSLAA